jgi:predicted phage baseplate assembly protein
MPIRPPALDDRSFDDLVAELVARIPAHTPEWTQPRAGDPGRTLIELFAWLGDTILYRANLIPERQRLAFLRLLGMPLTPARPARGLVSLSVDERRDPKRIEVPAGAAIEKPVPFQTTIFTTVFPLVAQAYIKRVPDDDEHAAYERLLPDLTRVYGLSGQPVPYVTTPVFENGAMSAAGVDIIRESVDHKLWIALMAPEAKLMKQALDSLKSDQPLALNVGLALAYEIPGLTEDIGARARIPLEWQLSTGKPDAGDSGMRTLEVLQDTTKDLSRNGVVRLALPPAQNIGAPASDPRQNLLAGVGASPPRVDAAQDAERQVAWLSLEVAPGLPIESLKLAWAGINAVEIEQLEALAARTLGASDGGSDQVFDLAVSARGSVDAATLAVEAHDPTATQRLWTRVDDLGSAGPLDCVYRLDAEAGTLAFGDGIHGRVPAAGAEIVVRNLLVGGGLRGNLPPGSLAKLDSVIDLVTRNRKKPPQPLKVLQALPTLGGADAETLPAAERRIPAFFRHKDRVVTVEDYRLLARQAPGAEVGRIEVLPRFKPHERQEDIPGVVSVMVLPARPTVDYRAPYPRADRPLLETVHAFLDARRPVATELYVIGCVYKPLGVSVAVQIRDGPAREQVLLDVQIALRRYLWPLPLGQSSGPGGTQGDWSESARSDGGYPLGRRLTDRELEVVVARVPGVAGVSAVNLFAMDQGKLVNVGGPGKAVSTFTVDPWELPELVALAVVEGIQAPDSVEAPFGRGAPGGGAGDGTGEGGGQIAVPVVRELC